MLKLEFDENKAVSNLEKHSISFEEAKTVFNDFAAYIFDDLKHFLNEKRELIFGNSNKNNLLIVCFAMRNNIIRIINVRLTNKIEKMKYEENKIKNR